jgi:hypothetical protein
VGSTLALGRAPPETRRRRPSMPFRAGALCPSPPHQGRMRQRRSPLEKQIPSAFFHPLQPHSGREAWPSVAGSIRMGAVLRCDPASRTDRKRKQPYRRRGLGSPRGWPDNHHAVVHQPSSVASARASSTRWRRARSSALAKACLGQLAGRLIVVLDLQDGFLRVHHTVVDDGVHLHRDVVAGDDILWRNVQHTRAQVS